MRRILYVLAGVLLVIFQPTIARRVAGVTDRLTYARGVKI